jgi:hypothetical protein
MTLLWGAQGARRAVHLPRRWPRSAVAFPSTRQAAVKHEGRRARDPTQFPSLGVEGRLTLGFLAGGKVASPPRLPSDRQRRACQHNSSTHWGGAHRDGWAWTLLNE